MNFIREYQKGQAGGNKGLYMGAGLDKISRAIGGVQKHRIYGVGSPPKVGKSTFVDYGFIIQPYLHAIEHNIPVEWIYFSYEIDRVSKEFDFASFFLFHDYGIESVALPEGVTVTDKKGTHSVIDLSSDYLRGRKADDNGNLIPVKPEIFAALQEVYEKRIIPLFGEWSDNGVCIKKGYIIFIEEKENPTGLYKYLKRHAELDGHFILDKFGRTTGYKRTSNHDKYTIIIVDHLRKLKLERGWLLKQTVDKMSEYMVELRNWCDFIFVPIIHTGRNLGNSIQYGDDQVYPTGDDIKDTGNLSEDVDYLFTLFDPNDTKYKLKRHFDLDLKDSRGDPYHPRLKTIHLVESRHTQFPLHFKVNMRGNIKSFEQLETT